MKKNEQETACNSPRFISKEYQELKKAAVDAVKVRDTQLKDIGARVKDLRGKLDPPTANDSLTLSVEEFAAKQQAASKATTDLAALESMFATASQTFPYSEKEYKAAVEAVTREANKKTDERRATLLSLAKTAAAILEDECSMILEVDALLRFLEVSCYGQWAIDPRRKVSSVIGKVGYRSPYYRSDVVQQAQSMAGHGGVDMNGLNINSATFTTVYTGQVNGDLDGRSCMEGE